MQGQSERQDSDIVSRLSIVYPGSLILNGGVRMSYENMGRLIDHWMNYEPFREALRRDPQAALQKSGITLNPEELKVFKQVDWTVSDEELKARISKAA